MWCRASAGVNAEGFGLTIQVEAGQKMPRGQNAEALVEERGQLGGDVFSWRGRCS